ncbi:hypothetical protein ACQCVP_13255 [Rossellomorea vietnamensis]
MSICERQTKESFLVFKHEAVIIGLYLKGEEGRAVENILKQILSELRGIKTDVGDLKADVGSLKTDVGDLKADVGDLKTDVGGLKTDVGDLKTDVLELKTGQARLENGLKNLQKNIIDSLGVYTEKITDHVDARTEVLNKRVYHVESDSERLSRQQGS